MALSPALLHRSASPCLDHLQSSSSHLPPSSPLAPLLYPHSTSNQPVMPTSSSPPKVLHSDQLLPPQLSLPAASSSPPSTPSNTQLWPSWKSATHPGSSGPLSGHPSGVIQSSPASHPSTVPRQLHQQTTPLSPQPPLPSGSSSAVHSYPARLGRWICSYYYPSDSPDRLPSSSLELAQAVGSVPHQVPQSTPNPTSHAVSQDSRGWTRYFSSQKPMPGTSKVDERRAETVQPVEFSCAQGRTGDRNHTLKPPLTTQAGECTLVDPGSHCRSASTSAAPSNTTSLPQSQAPSEPTRTTVLPPLTSSQVSSGRSGKRIKISMIPNLLLPSFEDVFLTPPRSLLPTSHSHSPPLAFSPCNLKKTFGLVKAYVLSPSAQALSQAVSESHGPSKPTSDSMTCANQKRISGLLDKTHDKSIKLPRSLGLLGVNTIQRLKRVKRMTIIAIHGWFPGPWLESVLGKPTGTSTKFAEIMRNCLVRYFENKLGEGPLNAESIVMIPLVGEGKVDQRADKFYQAICEQPYWLDCIKTSDALFVVSHSQGSVVSCKLIEKLVKELGIDGHRVCSLCMCGIWNGPYVGLNTNYAVQPVLKLLEGPAAHELFEFQDRNSPASRALVSSLNTCLSSGVKLLLVGSLNDPVVPLYSALNVSVDHPLILRSVYIDSRQFMKLDFLINLIVFCQVLRNAGLSDHGLSFYLSESLIGNSLGVGHSCVYEETDAFDLAIRYFFETSSGSSIPERPTDLDADRQGRTTDEIEIDESINMKTPINPYQLPWVLRGLIEDSKVKTLFEDRLRFLRLEFNDWNPSAKGLKELKIRLEPLKLSLV